MIEEVARLLMLLCLRQASSPEPAEPVYPEPGSVGGADHRPLPPPHPPHLPPHRPVGPRGGSLQDRARPPGSGFPHNHYLYQHCIHCLWVLAQIFSLKKNIFYTALEKVSNIYLLLGTITLVVTGTIIAIAVTRWHYITQNKNVISS